MARPLRIEYDGAVYHVTSRGNARQAIYKDDTDRSDFLGVLQKVNIRFNWLCHAYCLMKNHYHLIIETPDGNLSAGMRQLNGVYTQRFNKRYHRLGHIFQGRYKAILVQKESHLLEVCRYVVLNPVRARLAQKPEDWEWSSYRSTAGLERPHPLMTVDWLLGQFGDQKKNAQRRYIEFVRAGIGAKGIWGELRSQSLLGKEAFAEELMEYLKGHRDIKEIPRSQRHVGRPPLKQLFSSDMRGKKKERDEKIIEAIEQHAYSLREVADYLGLHYTTVSRIINGT
ncbi:MAG: transposase [Nitrospiraceae bacterium]|nr:transposase [Nitrospiraceae bacterium]